MHTQIHIALATLVATFAPLAQARTLYVAQAGQTPDATSPAYSSWSGAASNLQDAVAVAASGDVIMIGTGRYTSVEANVVFIENKALSLVGAGGRDQVIIDGEGTRRGIRTLMQSASGHLRIEGLTVTNAVTSGDGGGIWARWMGTETGSLTLDNVVVADCQSGGSNGGGGLYFQPNLTIALYLTNCVLRGNRAAAGHGGGILMGSATVAEIVDSELLDNHAHGGGGGLDYTGQVVLRNTRIAGNTTGSIQGGGVRGSTAGSNSILLERCRILDNVSEGWGGGIFLPGGTATLRNCLIAGNFGHRGGGATVRNASTVLVLENSTVVGNQSRDAGAGGINLRDNAHCAVTNSIVYYNQDGQSGAITRDNIGITAGTLSMAYSCTTRPAPPPGEGNIDTDPGFVDPGSGAGTDHVSGDYRLARGSPCMNAGTLLAWMDDDARDLDGNRRVDRVSSLVDMGAYEYQFGGTLILVR